MVEQEDANTQLNVIGDAGVVSDNYTWIEVQNPETEKTGWVADEFVELAPN